MNLHDRVPPQNIEAEQAVLSALFINNQRFGDIEFLSVDDFYRTAHKNIFGVMLELMRRQKPVDLVTVANKLKENGTLEEIGQYLYNIADSAPLAINIKHYAEIISGLAKKRQMINIATGIVEAGFNKLDVEDYISQAQTEILNIQTTTSKDRLHKMDALMHDAIDRIEQAQKQQKPSGFRFGLPLLDSFSNISGSKLFLIAARPSMGKTALALSVSLYLAKRGHKVGILSIEMDKESLADRFLSVEADVNSLCFYSQDTLNKKASQDILDSANLLSELPILIDDADCRIQDVERKCRKMKKEGCEIIFIDQLSKIRGDSKKSKFEVYTDNCSAIALLKKELRLPIGLLCQLNRNVEMRKDKTPEMSDLKQTGMLEEDADLIFFIFRPGYYDSEIHQSQTKIILAKNRQGATGIEDRVLFNQKRGMFNLI